MSNKKDEQIREESGKSGQRHFVMPRLDRQTSEIDRIPDCEIFEPFVAPHCTTLPQTAQDFQVMDTQKFLGLFKEILARSLPALCLLFLY